MTGGIQGRNGYASRIKHSGIHGPTDTHRGDSLRVSHDVLEMILVAAAAAWAFLYPTLIEKRKRKRKRKSEVNVISEEV